MLLAVPKYWLTWPSWVLNLSPRALNRLVSPRRSSGSGKNWTKRAACATTALLAFVARTLGTGVSDVKFLPTAQASAVIEALMSMLDRAKRQAQAK